MNLWCPSARVRQYAMHTLIRAAITITRNSFLSYSSSFKKGIYEIDYKKSDIKTLRVARHLELIFPLIFLQAFSFSSLLLTGNLLKTNNFSKFNLTLSRHFLSWLPSVLLSASSSLLKKCGSSFKAHKCRSVSGFDRTRWMVFILLF